MVKSKFFNQSVVLLVIFFVRIFDVIASTPTVKKNPRDNVLKPSFSKFEYKQEVFNTTMKNHVGVKKEVSFFFEAKDNTTQKSKARAFAQSLILPGWGQHYAESKTMMKVFIVSEVLLWGSYLGFTTWSNWLEDDYRTFAVTHAGVKLEGKPNRYFVDIGNFNTIFEFNQAQLRDRDVTDLYPENEEFFWRWDSDEHRREFEDMRIRSDRADNRAEFTLAAIFVNHLVSAIHSTLAVFKFNERLAKQDVGLRIDFEGYAQHRKIALKLFRHF